jgi:hypothetical protein
MTMDKDRGRKPKLKVAYVPHVKDIQTRKWPQADV